MRKQHGIFSRVIHFTSCFLSCEFPSLATNLSIVYRWGNTPLDEARLGGNKNFINLFETARTSQISELSDCHGGIQGTNTISCVAFHSIIIIAGIYLGYNLLRPKVPGYSLISSIFLSSKRKA